MLLPPKLLRGKIFATKFLVQKFLKILDQNRAPKSSTKILDHNLHTKHSQCELKNCTRLLTCFCKFLQTHFFFQLRLFPTHFFFQLRLFPTHFIFQVGRSQDFIITFCYLVSLTKNWERKRFVQMNRFFFNVISNVYYLSL